MSLCTGEFSSKIVFISSTREMSDAITSCQDNFWCTEIFPLLQRHNVKYLVGETPTASLISFYISDLGRDLT